MTKQTSIPPGYWENSRGDLVHESKVKDIDKLRDQVVRDLCMQAEQKSAGLLNFKMHSTQEVAALVSTSLEQYGVKTGGDKGNITLMSYDGSYKLIRQVSARLVFGEQLQAAKALIDQCITRWSEGGNANIRALVNDAFQVDKQGKISTDRVLGLRRLDIDDPQWLAAMKAIDDSIQIAGTKPYIRFYKRDDAGVYQPIVLDVAAV